MRTDLEELGRYADPSLLILTSLAGGPNHGYGLMLDIEAFSEVRMEPGTLYGALTRLERSGWIEALPAESRRRPYRLTEAGTRALREHLLSMGHVASVGLGRLAAGR